MYRIHIVTLFPGLVRAVVESGVVARAVKRGLFSLDCWNPRDFASDRHRTVDDRPYGGGPGMVMRVAPLRAALCAAREAIEGPSRVIYLSPQGSPLDQSKIAELATGEARLILLAGRYEGVDERLLESDVDEEISIGDYVLSGGELAAMVLVDAVVRLLPGVLGDEHSAEQDSFSAGLLDCPHYTRPECEAGVDVPAILLSGDHQSIARWREQQALGRTWLRRPDLLARLQLDKQQQRLLAAYQEEWKKGL